MRVSLTALVALLLALSGATSAQAADFTVQTERQLRDDVSMANANSDLDTIHFAAGFSGAIQLANGPLVVSNPLVISGADNSRQIALLGSAGQPVFSFTSTSAGGSTIEDLTLAGTGSNQGGALAAVGHPLTLREVQIQSSSALQRGGGVYAQGANLTVEGSTFTSDSAPTGGAIAFDGTGGGSLTVTNSTFSGNTGGGAISAQGADTNLTSVTIADNTGGAIAQPSGTVTLHNTIAVGGITANSVVGSHTITSGDPQLGPLQSNNGPTDTRLPANTSPAIDNGAAFGLPLDQRRAGRPIDSRLPNGPDSDGSDVGAVELQPGAFPAPVITQISPGSGRAGARIAITGTNLDTTQGVVFGSTFAEFSIQSSTRIVATVPKGRYGATVDVRVSTMTGGLSAGASFTYLPPLAPVLEVRGRSGTARRGPSVLVLLGVRMRCPSTGPHCVGTLVARTTSGRKKIAGRATIRAAAGHVLPLSFFLDSKVARGLRGGRRLKLRISFSARADTSAHAKVTRTLTIRGPRRR